MAYQESIITRPHFSFNTRKIFCGLAYDRVLIGVHSDMFQVYIFLKSR